MDAIDCIMTSEQDTKAALSHLINNEHTSDVSMEAFSQMSDTDIIQSSDIAHEISGCIEMNGQDDMDKDYPFELDWFDSKEVLDTLNLDGTQRECQESLETEKSLNKKDKKRMKRRRKSKSRRKQRRRSSTSTRRSSTSTRRSSTSTHHDAEQLKTEQVKTVPDSIIATEHRQDRSSVSISPGLVQASFNQTYQDTLSNLAISMKRSAFSRLRVIQCGLPN